MCILYWYPQCQQSLKYVVIIIIIIVSMSTKNYKFFLKIFSKTQCNIL